MKNNIPNYMDNLSIKKPDKIAIIHDWFLSNSLGGAEKVTILIDSIISKNFFQPEIYALAETIHNTEKEFFYNRKINTSFIQNLPFGKQKVQYFLPIIPFAIEQLNLEKYDLIISSSHIAAKGVLTSPDQLHISYIHTPMRYAWDQMNTYLQQSKLSKYGGEFLLRYILYKLRQWDTNSSKRADLLIANSNFTLRRIKKYWGLNAEVIHPPVDTNRFKHDLDRGDYYLCVTRLVPNKRVDLLVRAFNKLNLKLVIVGNGSEKSKLTKIANTNIIFYGRTSNKKIENLMGRCRAFVYAGIEDFGIAPVEAMAAGAPVIALAKGGLLDTVSCISNNSKDVIPTGLLFKNQTIQDIIDTISWFEDKKMWKDFDSNRIKQQADLYSIESFTNKFEKFTYQAWEKFKIRNKH